MNKSQYTRKKLSYLEDYDERNEENNQALDQVSEEEREVFIDKSQMSVFELHRRYLRDELELRPAYQRKDAWNNVKRSKLIESIIRNIPIPALYLSEREDEKWEVIDGQQRLRAFFQFMEDGYTLSGMPVLSKLNGKSFTALETKFQRKIEDCQLHIFIVKKESHPDIKFDIFQRINEGAAELNAQELRNCVFRGAGIELIRKLANNNHFLKVIGRRLQASRCKDEEIVLRFLSFYVKGYEQYNGNLNVFLNDTLRRFEEIIPDTSSVEQVFDKAMRSIYYVFQDKAFLKKEKSLSKINISLFDVITYSFAIYHEDFLRTSSDKIKNALNASLEDKEFYDSITYNTLTRESVSKRFQFWLEKMKEVYSEVSL